TIVGPRAARDAATVRDPRRAEPGARDLASRRGAEREPRARHRRARLRAGDRRHRGVGSRGRVGRQRRGTPRVSGGLMDFSLFFSQLMGGIGNGAVYASLALALVLIFRTTGILNFAQGEMALYSTYLFWYFTQRSVPVLFAILITMVISFI